MDLCKQVVLTILATLLALIQCSTSLDCKSRESNLRAGSRQIGADVLIDALDMEKCGEANFRTWQRRQSAFGCASCGIKSSDSIDTSRLPYEGGPPLEGGSPFLVDIASLSINVTTTEDEGDLVDTIEQYCTGVLIHKDIVLTTDAGCLSGNVHMQFGRQGYSMGETRTRKRWCQSGGMVVVSLDEPIEYVPGRIAPACLRQGDEPPSNKTTCSLTAYCSSKDINPNRPYWDYNRNLSSRPMKRMHCCCCFQAQNGAGRCRGDSSSPVVCYDRCSESQPDRVQAFVVGLIQQKGQKQFSIDNDRIAVISIHEKIGLLMKLVRALRSGVKGISCQNAPVKWQPKDVKYLPAPERNCSWAFDEAARRYWDQNFQEPEVNK